MKRFGSATLFLLTLFSCFFTPLSPTPLKAAEIAATVNNKVITKKDLSYKLKMALSSMNLPASAENKARLREQVLDNMIQDLVKIQIADDFDMKIKAQQIDAAVRNIEQQNNMPEGGLKKMLQKQGIPFHIMETQIKAQIVWSEYIRARYTNMIQVSDAEVEKALLELKYATDEPRYHLAEIVLYADQKQSMATLRAEANKIIEQVKRGAPFSMLASQISHAPSSVNGGDIGWVAESKLKNDIRKALGRVADGSISRPIESQNSIRIYFVRNRLAPGQFSKPQTTVSFKQVFVPNPADAFAFEIEENLKQVASLSKQISSCRVVDQMVKRKKGQVQFAENVPMQNLPGPVKDIISKTAVNRGSKPVYTGNGALFFVVCDRKTSNPKEPDADMMRAQLVDQKLQKISEQELRTRLGGAHVEKM